MKKFLILAPILSIIFSSFVMTQNSNASGSNPRTTNVKVGKESIETKLKKAASNAVVATAYLGMIVKERIESVSDIFHSHPRPPVYVPFDITKKGNKAEMVIRLTDDRSSYPFGIGFKYKEGDQTDRARVYKLTGSMVASSKIDKNTEGSFAKEVTHLFRSFFPNGTKSYPFDDKPNLQSVLQKCQKGGNLSDEEAVDALNNLLTFIKEKGRLQNAKAITANTKSQDRNDVLYTIIKEFEENNIPPYKTYLFVFSKMHGELEIDKNGEYVPSDPEQPGIPTPVRLKIFLITDNKSELIYEKETNPPLTSPGGGTLTKNIGYPILKSGIYKAEIESLRDCPELIGEKIEFEVINPKS